MADEVPSVSDFLAAKVEPILDAAVAAEKPVSGVVAVVTDRDGDVYHGAAGRRLAGGEQEMTPDTVFAIYSATKAVTATVALQLVQEKLLDLDASAGTYLPQIEECRVLEGFGADGQPQLRAPRRRITTRMLLAHTAGFGYDFFNADYARLTRDHGYPGVASAKRASLRTPLLFDPGERWEYGSSTDWVGLIVEAITGERLGKTMKSRIFEPLGMKDTGFFLSDRMRARRAAMHRRRADGSLQPMPDFELPREPEMEMGGHGLYSTAVDYARFIRMWLNEGRGPGGEAVLAPGTVAMARADQLGGRGIAPLPGVIPAIANDVEFFPGLPKSWSLAFMINDREAPTGRAAGSLAWAGLANLYYWIDPQNGIGGFWATQLFPFADPTSLGGYLAFECAVYDALRGGKAR